MKPPASALGLVNTKRLKKDDNVILSQAQLKHLSLPLATVKMSIIEAGSSTAYWDEP